MKPKKFNRFNAFIPVKDIRQTLDYYRDALGFYDEWIMGTDGGVRRDDMQVIFCQEPGYIKQINDGTYRLVLFWFVDNVDEIYREFTDDRKLQIVDDLATRPWGMREFSIYDINGYLIRISEETGE